jgi:flagellar biosynthesis protein FlhB
MEYIPKELIVPVAEVLRWVKEVREERERETAGSV